MVHERMEQFHRKGLREMASVHQGREPELHRS
jgi:hypothetical protein